MGDAPAEAPFLDCVTAPVAEARPPAPVIVPPIRDVHDLDWAAIARRADPATVRARMRPIVEAMESLLDRAEGPGLLFDADRGTPQDRAIRLLPRGAPPPLWFIGDLHGDLLALEAALETALAVAAAEGTAPPQLVFLGDLFDDEGHGLEVLLRVFELVAASPADVCVIAGNHDEALSFDGARFASSVLPSDFADFLNAHAAHEWIGRAGKLAVRFFARAPRALFFPDGLLATHGGFPLGDLHARLEESRDWNDPACLADFTWTRCHPTARRKLPNRFSRGSQFGHEDFAAFCALAGRLDRPVTHMVRGHDHVEERYAIPPAYALHPVLTVVALSRRLPRESYGPYRRVPTLARHVEGALPQVHRMHVPGDLIDAVYPDAAEPAAESASEAPA